MNMTDIQASTTPSSREEMAKRLLQFSQSVCAKRIEGDALRPAQTVLAAAFLEWAVADNPGITDFTDLLFAVEASLTDYDCAVHNYYTVEANKGGATGQLVGMNMWSLAQRGEEAVRRAAADAYNAVFTYMAEQGLIKHANPAY